MMMSSSTTALRLWWLVELAHFVIAYDSDVAYYIVAYYANGRAENNERKDNVSFLLCAYRDYI